MDMGVYIKDMEMPTERESYTITVKYNGLVFDTETGIQVAEAYGLPPHGRLIDADELFKEMERKGWFDNADRDKAEDLVLDAPTVIEAEEGE